MSDDLFTPPVGETTTPATPVVDQAKDYLAELVGEGKKFKDEKELARGKYEADAFIESLKRELSEVRQDAEKRATLEELVEKITKATSTNSEPTPNGNERVAERSNENETKAFDPKEIERIVSERIQQETSKVKAQANLENIKKELVSAWGTNYVSKLNERARELGLKPEDLNRIAATQPELFRSAVGLNGRTTSNEEFVTPPTSNRGPQSAPNNNNGERTKAYYDKIRKENPKEYLSSKVQIAMHKDAMRLGEKFFT